jgi:hypothetical protein
MSYLKKYSAATLECRLKISRLLGFAQKLLSPGGFLAQRRKDAKRCRVSKGFLCAFAPLREKYSP